MPRLPVHGSLVRGARPESWPMRYTVPLSGGSMQAHVQQLGLTASTLADDSNVRCRRDRLFDVVQQSTVPSACTSFGRRPHHRQLMESSASVADAGDEHSVAVSHESVFLEEPHGTLIFDEGLEMASR